MSGTSIIRVLLVDDHKMFLEGLVAILQREQDVQIVGTAGSLAELRDRLAECEPDVVLMDYRLPDGDGVEGARAVRELHPGARIVMLTALDDEAVVVRAIEAGSAGFVTKDEVAEQVIEAIRAAASGSALVSPRAMARLLPRMRDDTRATDLTRREMEVLRLVARGASNAEIASHLVISPHTVRNHVQSILTKLDAHSKLEAVAEATRRGLIRQA